jgi:putative membrane protein
MRYNIILRQIAFAHSMRCQLRRQSPYEEIARSPERTSPIWRSLA